jgi:hypothetical protein
MLVVPAGLVLLALVAAAMSRLRGCCASSDSRSLGRTGCCGASAADRALRAPAATAFRLAVVVLGIGVSSFSLIASEAALSW